MRDWCGAVATMRGCGEQWRDEHVMVAELGIASWMWMMVEG